MIPLKLKITIVMPRLVFMRVTDQELVTIIGLVLSAFPALQVLVGANP